MHAEFVPLIEAAGAAVLALSALGLTFFIRWIHSKIQISLVERALTAVSTSCHSAVTHVWTTYVEALKKASEDGTLTEAEKRMAKDKAIAAAKAYLGPQGIALVLKAMGIDADWLDRFLGDQVESSLAAMRRAERSSWAGLETKSETASSPSAASAQA